MMLKFLILHTEFIQWRLKTPLIIWCLPSLNLLFCLLVVLSLSDCVCLFWGLKKMYLIWHNCSTSLWWRNADGRTELMPCWLSATSKFGISLRLYFMWLVVFFLLFLFWQVVFLYFKPGNCFQICIWYFCNDAVA